MKSNFIPSAVVLFTFISAIPNPTGTQFITGPCSADSDCASGCCERDANICRAPLSLNPGVESCKDGRTPEFNNGPAHFVQIGESQAASTVPASSSLSCSPILDNKPQNKAPGTQFITGPCSADSDCASGCCERDANICRAPLSLNPGVESCKDGRTPEFNNGPAHFVTI